MKMARFMGIELKCQTERQVHSSNTGIKEGLEKLDRY